MFKIDNNLGKMIKTFRKKANLTQPELAELLNVSFSTLRRWEAYGGQPRIDELKKLCEVLNCTEAELLNGPEGERSHVTLSYDWKKFEKGDVDMTGKGYELFLGADGVVGIKGSMLLKSKEAIKNFLAEIEEQLTVGYEAQERRGALKKGE